jgi:hypothetical protein
MSQEKTNGIIDHLIKKDLLVEHDGIIPTNWDERQYKSDTSAERTRQYRERKAKAKQEAEAKKKERNNSSGKLSDGECDVTVSPPDTDTNTHSDTDKKNKNLKKRAKGMDMLLKAGVPEDLAEDYLAVRRAKKAPFTKTAMKGLAGEAEKANIDLNKAITICINRNWTSFNSEWSWDTKNGNNHGTNKSLYKSAIQTAAESISQAVQDDFTEHQQSFCPDVRDIR